MSESETPTGEVRQLWIPGPVGRLEATLRVATPAHALAVIAHPHPQHGGTLHNPVVFHTARELNRIGLTTLRFNFRGVGSSEGTHDDGEGETADVGAAVAWLRGLARDLPLLAIGYSFGSWCALRHAASDPAVAGLVAIGLPSRRYDLVETIQRFGRPLAAVQGELDEFGSPDEVRSLLSIGRPAGLVHAIPGAEHLFPGLARVVADAVVVATREILDAKPTGPVARPPVET